MKANGQIKVELQDQMGTDKSIAEAAWTSSLDYQKKQNRGPEDVKRVVEMLATLKHSVPFESIIFRFWIKMPIQTDRQFMTHRIASHSGMSGRYRTMPSEYLFVPGDVSEIIEKIEIGENFELDNGQVIYGLENMVLSYYDVCDKANNMYEDMILVGRQSEKNGYITNSEFKRFREFMRGMLPQNNMTERVTVMNLRSFANFQKLRNSTHAQPEIRKVAELMLEEVKEKALCPIALEWLEKNNWEL